MVRTKSPNLHANCSGIKSQSAGRLPSDHPCAATGCSCPGRRRVDDAWWCLADAPKTAHRNCTHSLGVPGQPCPYCLEVIPCP